MTMIPCMICGGDGKVEQNRDCPTCSGNGEIEADFGMTEGHYMGMFNMIVEDVAAFADVKDKLDDVMDKCTDLEDKVNDVMDKCNDIFEKVSE